MAIRDIETFVRERMALFDPNEDVADGSPFDVQVLQPLVRRLGTDPFTVDITTFVNDRMTQAFPELAMKEADALTDIITKPVTVLWDPLTRETKRVGNNLSFRDPSTLTLDEADALGGNFFNPRKRGVFSRGAARIFFSQPQNVSISPVNFFTSKNGLHFFPTEIQSIRTQEMLLNVTAEGLYYFDVNVIAEGPGSEYNIGPNELATVANVPAAVRVQNRARYRFGEDEETAVEYVGRLEQSLSERSLVTLRGVSAKTLDAFPEVNRLNVVGFNDPEMQRDVITGGGLGALVAAGTGAVTVPDGEGKALTRRISVTDPVSFIDLISGDASSWVITVFGAFGATPIARDLTVRRIVSATEVDVENQVLVYSTTPRTWSLRKREVTLSGIPGGILFPDTANGTVSVPDNEVHIGGAYDLHVRGTGFDEATLSIDNVTDDDPLLRGSRLTIEAGGPTNVIRLSDMILNSTYVDGDESFKAIEDAAFHGYIVQILEGVDAGNYRIVSATQVSGQSPRLVVEPEPTNPGLTEYRWRLFDDINIDLVEPKETRIDGEDLRTVQGTDIVDTLGGTDFDARGVAENDTLRIFDGPDAGDYTIIANPIAPSFDKLQLDRVVSQSRSNLQYTIFRPNAGGGVQRPVIRVTKIELLDTSNQPVGSTIPYAKPVDIQTRAFQNSTRGVKHDLRDARLGLLSRAADSPAMTFTSANGETLIFRINGVNRTVTLVGANPTVDSVITQVNTQLFALTGLPDMAVKVAPDYFGIRPAFADVAVIDGTARNGIFGNEEYRSVRDVRSDDVDALGGWLQLSPLIDLTSRLDVFQVLDGFNIGFYEAPFLVNANPFPSSDLSTGLLISQAENFAGFAPEVVRRVQVGARSIGSARVYFLEPTSFEVDAESRFSVSTDAGILEFMPDPTLEYQRIPALPSGAVPVDGETTAGVSILESVSQDFIKSGIRPGDNLEVSNHPIAGTVVMTNPVVALVNKTLIFSLDGGPDRVLTFIRDDVSLNPNEVSRLGVIDQINAAAGEEICELTGANTLEFTTTRALVVRAAGTANPTILGDVAGTVPPQSFAAADQTNESPHAGRYEISSVTTTQLTVFPSFGSTGVFPNPLTRQSFRVFRQGVQRVTTTGMAENEAEAGLFYFDVELISLGTGDQWNVDRGLQMRATGYRSDGYYLTTEDASTSFSAIESVGLVLSRTLLENGVDDDPQNATQISGQNIQVTYERAPLINDLQNFIGSEVERVVCSSPLSRYLIPHFVRFDVSYIGGSRESVIVPEVEQHIRDIYPQGALESSSIQKIVMNRGATSITNPLDLIAIVHYTDRTVYASRSQNSLSTGRLAAFIPDRLNIVRRVT